MRTTIAKPEAVLVRLHCWLHVTKEHRAVADTAYSAYVSLLCQLDTTARLRPSRHLHGSLDRLRRKLHCPNERLADGTNKDSPRSESLEGDEAYPRRDSQPL